MLPTNASVVLVGVRQIGIEDGTPVYDEAARGPYRCWLRSLSPEEVGGEIAAKFGRINYFAKVYVLHPGPAVSQSDNLRITVDGQEAAVVFEAVSVRERLGAGGLDHWEIVARRAIEGR